MKQTPTDALMAIGHLLEVDLNKVTWEQRQAAKTTLQGEPSTLKLISAVNTWAMSLADVCRSHSAKCAEIHKDRGEENPAIEAMRTIQLALCEHLRLPADPANPCSSLIGEDWPESNALRDFVLYIADAPVNLVDEELVVTPTLPRWKEPRGSFGRRIAGLPPDAPEGPQNAAFLSAEETEHALRGTRRVISQCFGSEFHDLVRRGNPCELQNVCCFKQDIRAASQRHSGRRGAGAKQHVR